jgi:hypothetical protein
MRLTGTRLAGAVALVAACAALFAPTTASAAGATYPGGGSGFDGGAEGWSAGASSCSPAELLCSSEAAYDSTAGNPPGSIAARTTVTVNFTGTFKGVANWISPQFTVPVEPITGAALHLERAFDPGGLVDVEPTATYAVTLTDLTAGTSVVGLSGAVDEEDEEFAQSGAPVAVVGGHTYRLAIESVTAQSTLALSPASGTTSLRFDNIGLTVRSGGGNAQRGGNAGALSSRRLFSLLRSGAVSSPVVLRGKRLFVKVNCPRDVGRACRIAAQGLLSKRKAATRKRVVKVGMSKTKQIALRVKPAAQKKLAKRKRLLVRERVSAGGAHATLLATRKLIRRG